jgi:hypothetical protein
VNRRAPAPSIWFRRVRQRHLTPSRNHNVRLALALGERDADSLDFSIPPEETCAEVHRSYPSLNVIDGEATKLLVQLHSIDVPVGERDAWSFWSSSLRRSKPCHEDYSGTMSSTRCVMSLRSSKGLDLVAGAYLSYMLAYTDGTERASVLVDGQSEMAPHDRSAETEEQRRARWKRYEG